MSTVARRRAIIRASRRAEHIGELAAVVAAL